MASEWAPLPLRRVGQRAATGPAPRALPRGRPTAGPAPAPAAAAAATCSPCRRFVHLLLDDEWDDTWPRK